MEIKLLDTTGVPASEIEAHQRIQKTFDAAPFTRKWRGYASFKMGKGKPGEGDDDCDLILITHTHIILLELKSWYGGSSRATEGAGT